MSRFFIGSREVGDNVPPLVIPEAGINHNGSFDKAIEMVDAARKAGSEIIKFQTHITEAEMIKTDMRPGTISDEPLWDIIKRAELSQSEESQLAEYVLESGMIFLSTPFSREAADRLMMLGVPAFKIGSGECNNIPLLEHIGRLGQPVILSTGMNSLESVRRSVRVLDDRVPICILHCTSAYPAPYSSVRLGALEELKREFPGIAIGISDHSLNIWTSLAAVAMGACVIEKHFTPSLSWPGPDVPMSITPPMLADLVVGAKAVWQARGGGVDPELLEQSVAEFAFASVVTISNVEEGAALSEANIWVKRPGNGDFSANEFTSLIGRRVARDLPSGHQLRFVDLV